MDIEAARMRVHTIPGPGQDRAEESRQGDSPSQSTFLIQNIITVKGQ